MSCKEAQEVPAQFNFEDWDGFYSSAVLYHEAKCPQARFLNERIATFREFMSDKVIDYLGGFVLSHPRYDTTEGWADWASGVSEMLDIRQVAIEQKKVKGTLDELLLKVSKSKISKRQLWRALDLLVSTGKITSVYQRQVFWDAHSPEEQEKAAAQSAFFDPSDKVWEKADSSEAKIAEQQLSRAIECSLLDESVIKRQSAWKKCLFVYVAQLIASSCLLLLVLDVYINHHKRGSHACAHVLQVVLCAANTHMSYCSRKSQLDRARQLQRERSNIWG